MFCDKLYLLSTVNILGMEDDKHEPSSRKQDASPLTHSAHFPLGLPKILSLGMTKVKSVGSFENVGSFDTAGSFDSCKLTNINKPKANYFIEREVNASSGNDESDHIHGCVNSQDELILKLSSRDETIIKEQRLSNSYRIKEEWFVKSIYTLKTKLKENEIVTKQHDDALSEYK